MQEEVCLSHPSGRAFSGVLTLFLATILFLVKGVSGGEIFPPLLFSAIILTGRGIC